MKPETAATLSTEISEGRWLIVADTLDPPAPRPDQSLLRWLDCLVVVAQNKRAIGFITAVATVLAAAFSFLVPNTYTASTQLLPPQQSQPSVSALLGQAGELASLAGRDILRNPSAVFVVLLRSRSVADRIIARFDLMKIYATKRYSSCRQQLEDRTQIETTKEGVITIRVEDHDPRRAAAIANGYVEELIGLNQKLAIGEAGQRRVFFEAQVEKSREQLASAEEALKQVQERSGMVQPDAQTKALIESAAALRVHIAVIEAQLQQIRASKTDQNPDVMDLQRQQAAFREQLRKIETLDDLEAGLGVPVAKLPQAGLEYIRRLRDVKYYETVFGMLSKQLEAARIDEAKEGVMIQVIDSADVPDRKSGPNRLLITLLGGAAGLTLGMFGVLAKDVLRRNAMDPGRRDRLTALRSCFRPAQEENGNAHRR